MPSRCVSWIRTRSLLNANAENSMRAATGCVHVRASCGTVRVTAGKPLLDLTGCLDFLPMQTCHKNTAVGIFTDGEWFSRFEKILRP